MTTMIAETESRSITHACACGCGRQIGRKSKFAPGHDAKMISAVVLKVVHGTGEVAPALRDEPSLNDGDGYVNLDIAERIRLADQAIADKFGKPLAAKFDGAVHNAWARYDKPGKAIKRTNGKPRGRSEVGTVKITRWAYPARRNSKGVTRYTATDESKPGEWVPAGEKVAATFQPA